MSPSGATKREYAGLWISTGPNKGGNHRRFLRTEPTLSTSSTISVILCLSVYPLRAIGNLLPAQSTPLPDHCKRFGTESTRLHRGANRTLREAVSERALHADLSLVGRLRSPHRLECLPCLEHAFMGGCVRGRESMYETFSPTCFALRRGMHGIYMGVMCQACSAGISRLRF